MSLYISNRLVRVFLNNGLILRIDPRKIHYHVGTSRPGNLRVKQKLLRLKSKNTFTKFAQRQTLRLTNAFESFVVDDANYQDITEFKQHRTYNRIKSIIEHRDNYKDSAWYLDLLRELHECGSAKHKKIVMRSESEIDHFMQSYVLQLLESLERDGFDPRKGGGVGRALIGKDGSIHKSSSGRHRFYAARELGIKPIPLRISGVHEEWYRRIVGSNFDPRKLKAALSDVQRKHV